MIKIRTLYTATRSQLHVVHQLIIRIVNFMNFYTLLIQFIRLKTLNRLHRVQTS